MFDMLNRAGDEHDNEYDKAMAASFIDVSSFFHQEHNNNTIWAGAGAPEAKTPAAMDFGSSTAETARLNATGVVDMPQHRYEIIKLTEDVMESGIDPKEWQQECKRVDRQLHLIH